MGMGPINDLNLLVTLEIVIDEGHLGRAATRLGVSRSAVSHALRRLRNQLNDPLVVKVSGGVAPTERAQRLIARLRPALRAVEEALIEEHPFDPASDTCDVCVSAADLAQVVILPPLAAHLAVTAPGTSLRVVPPPPDPYAALADGRVDLALGVFAEPQDGIRRQTLCQEHFVCVLRHDHPAEELTLETYLALEHVEVSPLGRPGSIVDRVLAEQGRSRRVRLTVPSFLIAGRVVALSDRVATLPHSVAIRLAEEGAVRLCAAPVGLPEFALAQIWHERTQQDAGQCWFRRVVREAAKS